MKNKKKNFFNLSNGITGLMILFIITMLIVPGVKSSVIQGLMNIGLFQPDISDNQENKTLVDNSVAFKGQDGETISLNDLKSKVVFINFWATWCPPCIAEMPAINKMKQHFKDDNNVVILMVDADNNLKKSVQFMKRKKYDLSVFLPATSIPENMFQSSLPTTLVIDKKGQIVFKHEGAADYKNQKFIDFMDKLRKE
ncbi:MAG: TlpA family protein disulfide reductase [Oligoflexus sp.]|nr:TlpA family protein disulfide reductase [Pseudopedobacter sp.]